MKIKHSLQVGDFFLKSDSLLELHFMNKSFILIQSEQAGITRKNNNKRNLYVGRRNVAELSLLSVPFIYRPHLKIITNL